MQKRPILLMELVISLVLFSFIIGILFSSYREFAMTKSMLRKEKELVLNRQKLQLRLGQIFAHLKSLKKDGTFCNISYDNGLDPIPEFRGELEALLFIDKGRLALVTWPEKGVGRKEILLEPASSFTFSFFDTKKGNWSPIYPEEKPPMMQIIIDQTPYPFFL